MSYATNNVKRIELDEPFFKKYLEFIVAGIVLIAAFFFFMINDIRTEKFFINIWVKPAEMPEVVYHDKNHSLEGEFYQNNIAVNRRFLHYFGGKGETTFFLKLGYKDMASAGTSNFALYSKSGVRKDERTTRFFTRFGKELWARGTAKYPELSPNGKMISFHTSDNMTFVICDEDNNLITELLSSGDLITSTKFAKYTSDYIAGYVNGYVISVTRTGKTLFRKATLASKINVTKGVGISERGSFIGVVSGLYPEILTVYESSGKMLWYRKTGLNRRREVPLYLSETDNILVTLGEYAIDILDLKTGALILQLPLAEHGMEDPSYMLVDNKNKRLLISINEDGHSKTFVTDIKNGKTLWSGLYPEYVYGIGFSDKENEIVVTMPSKIITYKELEL